MKNDKRITFDKFKLLILKAMNMRKNEHQIKLLFEVMDSNKAGRIYARDLKKTALSIGIDIHKSKCDEIIEKCSRNNQYITHDEFLVVMTQPAEDQDEIDSDTISLETIESYLAPPHVPKGTKISADDVSIAILDAKFTHGTKLNVQEPQEKSPTLRRPGTQVKSSIRSRTLTKSVIIPVVDAMRKGESTPADSSNGPREKNPLVELIKMKRANPASQVGGPKRGGRNRRTYDSVRVSNQTTAANTQQVSAENSIDDTRCITGLGSFFKE